VTDSAPLPQSVTNIYHVLVVLTNGQPAFPGAEARADLPSAAAAAMFTMSST